MKQHLPPNAAVPSRIAGRHQAVNEWISLNGESGGLLLDIGCGFGIIETFVVSRQLPLNVIAVEPTFRDLETFRRRVEVRNVAPLVSTGLALGLKSSSVDLCVATEVLEHIPVSSELVFLEEIARVLKPGGRLLLTTPSNHSRSRILDPAYWLSGHRHYDHVWLSRVFERAGLKVEVSTVRGGWADLASLWDLYVSKWLLRRPPLLASRLAGRVDNEWRPGVPDQFMTLWLSAVKPL